MSPEYAQAIIDTVRDPLLVLDSLFVVQSASRSFHAHFKTSPAGVVAHNLFTLAGGAWDVAPLRALLKETLAERSRSDDCTIQATFPSLGRRTLVINTRPFTDGPSDAPFLLLSIEDVTSRLEAEARAASGEAWLNVTLRSIGDAVIATDAQAHVTLMNPTAARLTGWSEAEAKGRPLLEVFNIVNEETRALVESPVAKAIRVGAIVGLANHTVLIARDGTEWPIDDSAAPIRNAAGDILGVVMVFHDITERRAAEREIENSEVRYRRLFESARDGILLMDPVSRRITDANPFMEELLDTPHSNLIDKELWQIGLIRDKDEAKRAFQQLLDTGYIRYEDLPLETAGGSLRDVEFVSNLYMEDHKPVIQCNVRDITERKRLADERERLLESEKAAHLACEAANRAKDVFLATLSHELRTPLNAILGWSVILRTSGKCDSPDVVAGLEIIERNARAQGKLIEDVLDVARIVSGKFRLQARPCDPAVMMHAAADAVRHAATAKRISLEVIIGPRCAPGQLSVTGDPARIQQALLNLLSNAVKFTPEAGRITVTLSRDDGNVVFNVTDTGKGIRPDFLPYVFDRFKQADEGTTRVYGGLGLGLSIVRHLVELHNGTVTAHSEGEGRGATFTINLPLQPHAAAPPPPDIPAEIPTLHDLHVLVVDDDQDARTLAGKALEMAGAKVELATTAADGFRLATESAVPPNVLVADIGMPGEDGYSLMRRLRAHGLDPKQLPSVALTAFAAPQDKRRALLAGFQVHLSKPFDPHELLAVVATLAGRTGH